jgi:hypothetical protein
MKRADFDQLVSSAMPVRHRPTKAMPPGVIKTIAVK